MSHRFSWITSGFGNGSLPCDIDLLRDPLAAVVPTLGSIIPGWLLVVPRQEALAIGHFAPRHRQELLNLARIISGDVRVFGSRTFILEHGPARVSSIMGCGVDHAHLHVVPMDRDLLTPVLADESVDWTATDAHDPWVKCQQNREYLLVCTDDGCYVGFPRQAQSQYFRKKIAQLQGVPDSWDYREWPCHGNAQRTIEHFSRVQQLAA